MEDEIFVCSVSELVGQRKKRLTVNNRDIVLVKAKDRFYALDSFCYHAGGPLYNGDIEEEKKELKKKLDDAITMRDIYKTEINTIKDELRSTGIQFTEATLDNLELNKQVDCLKEKLKEQDKLKEELKEQDKLKEKLIEKDIDLHALGDKIKVDSYAIQQYESAFATIHKLTKPYDRVKEYAKFKARRDRWNNVVKSAPTSNSTCDITSSSIYTACLADYVANIQPTSTYGKPLAKNNCNSDSDDCVIEKVTYPN